MGLDNLGTDESGTARRYVQPTKEDFEGCLDGTPLDFEIDHQAPGKEYVYDSHDFMPEHTGVVLRIFSTIDMRTDKARDKGADAIRTIVWNRNVMAPMGGRVKTLRIESWCKNLKKKINSLVDEYDKYTKQCPKCGRWMVIRDGKYGEFLACSGYPDCDHTEDVEDVLP